MNFHNTLERKSRALAKRIADPYKNNPTGKTKFSAISVVDYLPSPGIQDGNSSASSTGEDTQSHTEPKRPLAKPKGERVKGARSQKLDIMERKRIQSAKRQARSNRQQKTIAHRSMGRMANTSGGTGPQRSSFNRHVGPIRVTEFGKETNHPDGKVISSLWQCDTVAKVEHLANNWQEAALKKSLAAISKRSIEDDMRRMVELLLQGRATTSPNMLNPSVLELSWKHVFRHLAATAEAHPDYEFALVTFIDGEGATSAHAPLIDIFRSRHQVLRTIRAMGGNFIGVSELAMFKSHRHPDGGRHLQRHEHAILYGPEIIKKAKEVAKKHMPKFKSNITSAPQIDIRRVEASEVNLARVCAYLFKPPHKTMNWVPERDGKPGFMNQSEKGERMINHLRLAQIRSLLTIEDVLFAGGECKGIKTDLIKLLRETCRSNVPIETRPLHPDGIGSFWVEFNKAIKRPDYRLPIIGRSE